MKSILEKEKQVEIRRARDRAYYQAHRDRILARNNAWRKARAATARSERERVAEAGLTEKEKARRKKKQQRLREYYLKNRAKIIAYQLERYYTKKAELKPVLEARAKYKAERRAEALKAEAIRMKYEARRREKQQALRLEKKRKRRRVYTQTAEFKARRRAQYA